MNSFGLICEFFLGSFCFSKAWSHFVAKPGFKLMISRSCYLTLECWGYRHVSLLICKSLPEWSPSLSRLLRWSPVLHFWDTNHLPLSSHITLTPQAFISSIIKQGPIKHCLLRLSKLICPWQLRGNPGTGSNHVPLGSFLDPLGTDQQELNVNAQGRSIRTIRLHPQAEPKAWEKDLLSFKQLLCSEE